MRDYQPHKNNPYWLEPTVYKRVLSVVRDYDRMVRDYKNILQETPANDGQPHATTPGDPVERRVERMDRLRSDIRAVEMGLIRVPAEYRKDLLKNIQEGGWPVDVPAHYKTWQYWKKRFLYFVAEYLQLT